MNIRYPIYEGVYRILTFMAPCGIDFYIFAVKKNILETVPDSM